MNLRKKERPVQQYRRQNLQRPIRVLYQNEARREVFFGYALDLSAGGLFIHTANPKNIESTHDIVFNLPGERREIKATVSVIWARDFQVKSSDPPGMGLSFVAIEPEDRDAIEDFITYARVS